ncbi:GtrA family protein [Leptolyngbya sp. AN02str]|uniref:GtrA family protein n=1 Tax=Leptolyngbya sp. AN02str TaxID=3423363 RepID=UPI003D316CED
MLARLLNNFSRYPTYLIVGGGVTLSTILIRSIIGLIIEDDSTSKYLSSIVLTYIVGIYLSFVAHKSITFRVKGELSVTQVFKFIFIHIIGMAITLVCSIKLREIFLDAWMPLEISKMFAFALSALFVSVITYFLKKRMIFG